jgi:capsular exopolysaccharide synthesis family protein
MSQQDLPTEERRAHLREYLGVLWLRKWSIVLVTGLVVGGALAYSVRQTPLYRSESRVLVEAASISAQQTSPGLAPNMETEQQLVASSQVATAVIDDLGLDAAPREITPHLTVDVLQGTEILVISYLGPDPDESQRIAQAFARSYLQFRRQAVLQDLKAAAGGIQEQIEEVDRQINQAEAKLEEQPEGSAESVGIEADISSLTSQKASLEAEFNDLVDPQDLQVGSILEPAATPVAPVSPDNVRTGVLALLVGLLLGVGVAFLRERLDDRLRGRTDLEEHIGAPVLAVVPRVSNWKRRTKNPPLVTVAEPRGAPSEAYRTLRTSLLFAAAQRGAKTILVTSPHAGEGKTASAANLAVALAQARKRVILISADLRKPRLHQFFRLSNEVGLTSILIGEAKPWEAVGNTSHEYLKVVLSGPVPGNPAELLGSDAMGGLLGQFREVADFVILDSAPVLVVADALTLAPFADAVLFVADAEETTRGAVVHARSQLEQVNADIIGAVLNNFDPAKAKSSPYYYSYYYTYQQQETPQQAGRLRWRRAVREESPQPARDGRSFGRTPGGTAVTSEQAATDPGTRAAQESQLEGLWALDASTEEQGTKEGAASEPGTGRWARRRR